MRDALSASPTPKSNNMRAKTTRVCASAPVRGIAIPGVLGRVAAGNFLTKPKSSVRSNALFFTNRALVALPFEESVAAVPAPVFVAEYPAGGDTVTLYEPAGKFENRYFPFASVTVVVTGFPLTSVTAEPSAFVIVNVTPAIPGSPES